MRVAELSRRTGVTVASIKYYLREGLLPAGERTGPNQAAYGEDHMRRLQLIRAFIDVGGLSVAGTRDVLTALDDPSVPLHHVLGATSFGLAGSPGAADVPRDDVDEAQVAAERRLTEVVTRRGWRTDAKNPAWSSAVEVLATYERLQEDALADVLDVYAAAMEEIARHEVDTVLARAVAGGRAGVVEGVVIGTVLGDHLLAALRRLAHEDASARALEPVTGADPGTSEG